MEEVLLKPILIASKIPRGVKQVDETGSAGTVKSGDIRAMFANTKKPIKKIIIEID